MFASLPAEGFLDGNMQEKRSEGSSTSSGSTKSFDIFSWQGIMDSGRTAKVKHMIFGMCQASLAKSKVCTHGGFLAFSVGGVGVHTLSR